MNWILPKTVQSHVLTVLDIPVHYLSCGLKNDGPVLVLFHPMPLSSYLWVPVLERLADAAYCLAPDLLGFGMSGYKGSDYSVKNQIKVMCAWLRLLAKDRPLILLGHGLGSVIMHGVAAAFRQQLCAIAIYEGYLTPLTGSWDLGLPVEQLYHLVLQSSLYQKVVVEDFMMRVFLSIIAEGKLSEQDIAIYRQPHQTEDTRQVFLDTLLQMMSFSAESEFSAAICSGLSVYHDPQIKKVLMYSMPGLISGLLKLDEFRNQYPTVCVVEVGESVFLAPAFNPDGFSGVIIRDLLSQKSVRD
ncbi:MAG: alpha/beta fold hydrolase [Gammaproteobacteria bacterium]|jgi:haloalkane dehalogenase|nr:alpha/beta fold hydrolase [Gammaproteobacteria bacterium]